MKKTLIILLMVYLNIPNLVGQSVQLTAGVNSRFDMVSDIENWQTYQILAGVKWREKLQITARTGYFKRFDQTGVQFQLSGSWKIDSLIYMNVDLGTSKGKFLPSQTGYVELYRVMKQSEISLGYKYLNFNPSTDFITSSFGYYWLSEWTNMRVYLLELDQIMSTPLINVRLQHRHYWSKNNYLEFSAGRGENISRNTLEFVRVVNTSRYAGVAFSKRIDEYVFKIGYTYHKEAFNTRSRVRQELQFSMVFH